jgi:hypothetical protein
MGVEVRSRVPYIYVFTNNVNFLTPGTFENPQIPTYTQAMKNILAQPTLIQAILTVNILTTTFNDIPTEMAERLGTLTTHKSMHHILKNFVSAFLSCNFQQTNLDSLNYKTNSITILGFMKQSDIKKINVY